MSEVAPGIWVGGVLDCASWTHERVAGAVACVASEARCRCYCADGPWGGPGGPGVLFAGVRDDDDSEDFARVLDVAVPFVLGSQEVLVHCRYGVSRSVLVAAAAMALRDNRDLDVCLEDIRRARGRINPWPAYLAQTRAWLRAARPGAARPGL